MIAPEGRVLCRHHWQAAIREERRLKRRHYGASRNQIYKQWHPDGATDQCEGRTWW